MIVRKSPIFCLLVLALVAVQIQGSAVPNDDQDDDDDDVENDFDINFTVNRLTHTQEDTSEEDDDEDDDLDLSSLWKQTEEYPLYVIILGGFRWDMLEAHQHNLTAFAYLRKHGVSIPQVTPVFPPEDYPVWTSLATGRHPEDHGIVGDFMYDLKHERIFNASDLPSTKMAEWWKDASPFWSTAAKHGKKIAFYNWHDCQLPGAALEDPKDCRPYEAAPGNAHPSKSKILREFNEAFTKLWKDKYSMAVVYTDLLRRAAETHGPDSPGMIRALREIDDVLQAKFKDIEAKAEKKNIKMNVLVLSDYGLTDTSTTTEVNIDDYIDMKDVQYIIYASGYVSIVPYANHHDKLFHNMRDMPGVDLYLTKKVQNPPLQGATLIPDELQYGRGANTQDILVVAKPSFRLISHNADENDKIIRVHNLKDDDLKAGAGYNPLPEEIFYPFIDKRTIITEEINNTIRDYGLYHQFKWDMQTQAFAMGPDFKSNYVHKNPINSVDFYQLLCFLMQIPPEEHDGEWKNIGPMMTVSSTMSITPGTWIMTLWTFPLMSLHYHYQY